MERRLRDFRQQSIATACVCVLVERQMLIVASGCWLLVAGCWLLVGNWLPAAAERRRNSQERQPSTSICMHNHTTQTHAWLPAV